MKSLQRMKFFQRTRLAIGCLALGLLVVGCATAPEPNNALDQARSNVQRVSSSPQVGELAAVELQGAEEMLRSAETAWEQGAKTEVVNHRAYLAERQAEIAFQAARARSLDNRVEALSNERERVRLQARVARAERDSARARAGESRAEAQRRAAESKRVRAELEAMSAQAQREEAEREVANARAEQALAMQRAEELERETQDMRDRAQRLEQQVASLEAQPTERGLVLTLGSDVMFDLNSADLREGARRSIDRIAEFLEEYSERKVLVEGFTDSTGSAEYNIGLSERRAGAVQAALIERGVGEDRIRTSGLGLAYPVSSNETAAGRQLNRRVEIVISDDQQEVSERDS